MNSPAQDISNLLASNGRGVLAAGSGWGIFTGKEPISPNTTITVYDTGGFDANAKFLLDRPTVQIRIRGEIDDYLSGYNKAQEIKDDLLGIDSQILGQATYIGIWMMGDIFPMGRDDQDRPLFTMNWRMVREPIEGSPSTHRDPL